MRAVAAKTVAPSWVVGQDDAVSSNFQKTLPAAAFAMTRTRIGMIDDGDGRIRALLCGR